MKCPRCQHENRAQATFCEECASPLVLPFEEGRYLAEHIPGAQLHAFDGLGHLPIFTGRREFCAVLRRFVQTVKAGG